MFIRALFGKALPVVVTESKEIIWTELGVWNSILSLILFKRGGG
jgi:hypothetical protein